MSVLLLLRDETEVQPVNDDEQPDRLPPGHVERRQVSNEILAFQLTTLQDAQTTQSALLRDQIKEGFGDIRDVLNEHTKQIGEIKTDLAVQAARLAEVEKFRAAIEARERSVAKDTARELQSAASGATEARTVRLLAGIAITVVTLAVGIVGAYVALHGG